MQLHAFRCKNDVTTWGRNVGFWLFPRCQESFQRFWWCMIGPGGFPFFHSEVLFIVWRWSFAYENFYLGGLAIGLVVEVSFFAVFTQSLSFQHAIWYFQDLMCAVTSHHIMFGLFWRPHLKIECEMRNSEQANFKVKPNRAKIFFHMVGGSAPPKPTFKKWMYALRS